MSLSDAINYAINRKQLAEQVMEGHAIPAYSAVQGLPWQNPSVIFSDGDIGKSARHPGRGYWKINSAGVREKAGKEASDLMVCQWRQHPTDLAEAVRAMLESL